MSGVIGMTTYDAGNENRAIHGLPAVALRVGVALENWAHAAARREAARREASRRVRVARVIDASVRVEHDLRMPLRLF
ncbi:hypothetical protein [Pseudolysinimonas sp.]|jgi:hypothetical protein|uniref:hypothetical protein n=1 Tax=Pseudolysinimonas sp. TaxID=2680009 RepID=UPI003784D9BB